jgi:hypothetical protein
MWSVRLAENIAKAEKQGGLRQQSTAAQRDYSRCSCFHDWICQTGSTPPIFVVADDRADRLSARDGLKTVITSGGGVEFLRVPQQVMHSTFFGGNVGLRFAEAPVV